MAEHSCPQAVEAAAHQHRLSEIRLVPSGSGSSRRIAAVEAEQRERLQLRKLP